MLSKKAEEYKKKLGVFSYWWENVGSFVNTTSGYKQTITLSGVHYPEIKGRRYELIVIDDLE